MQRSRLWAQLWLFTEESEDTRDALWRKGGDEEQLKHVSDPTSAKRFIYVHLHSSRHGCEALSDRIYMLLHYDISGNIDVHLKMSQVFLQPQCVYNWLTIVNFIVLI